MRIVIDLQGVQSESRYRGIGRYSLSISKAIVRNRAEHEVIIVLSNLFPDTIDKIKSEFKSLLPEKNIKVWDGVSPTKECEEGNETNREISEVLRESFLGNLQPDVLLITSLFEGYSDNAVTSIKKFDNKIKIVVILYDLIPYIQKDIYLTHNELYTKHYLQKIEYFKKADLLLAISQSSSSEAFNYLSFSKEKIITISSAVDESFKIKKLNLNEKQNLLAKYNITKKTIVYTPGGFDIRKNFENLIKAYARLPKELQKEYQLVVVSKIDDGNKVRLETLAKNEKIDKKDFILTGYVSDEELISFYSICNLFVFTSIHEGFGLPVLEAMNCGVVVIGSNTTSIPEVIGYEDALFDPYSIKSIRDKMAEVLQNQELQQRLLEHNKSQIKKFSWDKSAKIALEAIKEVIPSEKKMIQTDEIINKICDFIPSHYDENELLIISKAIHFNQSQFVEKQLFLDVSELCQRDSATGVQRVVKSYLRELLLSPPDGYIVCPVYATVDEPYRYANKFTSKFLGEDDYEYLIDEQISWSKGDIFFGLDMQHHVQLAHKNFYHTLKNDGVIVKFLVYDLLPIELANLFKNNDHKKLHEELMKMFAQLDGVINISHTTSIAYKSWLESNKTFTLSNFSNEWLHMGVDMNSSMQLKGLPEDATEKLNIFQSKLTFLSVSTIEPRKKQDQILKAFELLWGKGIDANLIFVGRDGWKTESLREKILDHQEFNKKLFWLNGISDEYLLKVYENSTCLIVASINEGFGLPLIEAAQYNLPIIARDIEVFREVAQTYAYYFKGFEADDLASSIEKWIELYNENKHPQSTNMSYLTWKESAERLKELLVNSHKSKHTLFLDISELVQRDAKSGIQRVVRSIMLELFKNSPKDYDIQPVYATVDDGYRYATNFTYKFLGHDVDAIEEKYINYKSKDIFFLLDMQPQVQIAQQDFYQKMKKEGVKISFLLYDILPISLWHYFPKGNRDGFENWLGVMSKNNQVICISQAVKNEYKKWVLSKNIDINISWFHLGADINNSNPSRGLPKNYNVVLDKIEEKISFIMVGTLEPRKAHLQTLKAFENLWAQHIDVNLIIVGKEGWNVAELIDMIKNHLELNRKLFWLEGISDEYLEKVYEASDCLIAASEGEGFGLPLIESAQKKKPIIARDIPVFKEVAGEFAYYFENNKKPTILAQAIKNWLILYKDDKHPRSDDMPWLKWEESARELLAKVKENFNE